MPKSKLSAALSVFLVFFSGAVLGAFTYRLYSLPAVQLVKDANVPPRKLSPEEWRKKYVTDFAGAVKLDDAQIAGLNKILDHTREEFDKLNDKIKPERDALDQKWRPDRETIQAHQVESINTLLRPEQRPLYEAFRAERERLRKLHDSQRKK
jgi:uncharacterized membrane protein